MEADMNKVFNWLSLAGAYVRLNLRSHLEYRGAFFSQIFAMIVNNAMWLIFWALFFKRFPVLHGWDIKDVITIWGVTAAGFGLASALCGNALYLPTIVLRGQLDAWLLYPRALLPHLVLGKMSATSWGDAIFGYVVYVVFVRPDLEHFALFVLFTLTTTVLLIGFFVLSGSLSFFIGNAEAITEQWRFSLITFSTYPATLFHGGVKLVLYTLIPAGFVSYLPVEVLKRSSVGLTLLTIFGAFAMLALGMLAFYAGLRRYESGNLIDLKG
jgi:ABC-2 type transport system permease protein